MSIAMQTYQDLCGEIDILTKRIDSLQREYEIWYRNCFNGGKKPIAPLHICLKHMDDISKQIEIYQTLLEEKEKTREEIDQRMSQFQGIGYKVAYMRDIKGMTLAEIAAELGYSEIWIRKISSKCRSIQRVYTGERKSVVR